MACTVAGPHGPEFLPVGIYEIMGIRELPTTIQELKRHMMGQISTVIQELLNPMFDTL